MKPHVALLGLALCLPGSVSLQSAEARFQPLNILPSREVALNFTVPAGERYRITVSEDAVHWDPFVTLPPGTGGVQSHTDTAAPWLSKRYYRAVKLVGSPVTGDHLPTNDGDVLIHPVDHASLVLLWKNLSIYIDPVGGSAPYAGIPAADLILITHDHGDHFNTSTINAIKAANAQIVVGQYVYDRLGGLQSIATVLNNGQSATVKGVSVEAIAMYNVPPQSLTFHPKGRGNGYVVTLGGKRIYASGDTGDTPEMRALSSIDVAFVCMNLPYTMTVDQAASAVREFQPGIVYPYHYSSSDINRFKQLVGTDLPIEVRLRNWYP